MAVGFIAFKQSDSGINGIINQGTDIFEDGHRLFAVDDVLDGGFFGILTGDVVVAHIAISGEGVGDGAGGSVVRSQDEDIPFICGGGGGQVGFGQILGDAEVPVGGDLTNDLGLFVTAEVYFAGEGFGFAGVLDDEGAIGNLGLQYVPGALEEDEGVVVGSSARIEIERVAGATGIVNQVLGLLGTNSQAVEGDVVVDGVGVTNQTVVGDDAYASVLGSLAAAAAAVPSCGVMMMTVAPLVIRSSTLARSLAESPWLNRISTS